MTQKTYHGGELDTHYFCKYHTEHSGKKDCCGCEPNDECSDDSLKPKDLDIKQQVDILESSNKLMPKIYSFTEVQEILKFVNERNEKDNYHHDCPGCKDGHNSFWQTVTESEQWKLWEKEQSRRMGLLADKKLSRGLTLYDIPEVVECGHISPEHFQEFLEFIR